MIKALIVGVFFATMPSAVQIGPEPTVAQAPFGPDPKLPKLAGCKLPGKTLATSMRALPAQVRSELQRFFEEDFGDAYGAFNASDVIDSRNPRPQRRFLRAYRYRSDWIVWYEHGGRGYHLHALGIRRDADRSRYRIDGFARYTGSTAKELCAASLAFFAGARTSYDS